MENVKSEGEFYYKFSLEGLCLLMCKLEEILMSMINWKLIVFKIVWYFFVSKIKINLYWYFLE